MIVAVCVVVATVLVVSVGRVAQRIHREHVVELMAPMRREGE